MIFILAVSLVVINIAYGLTKIAEDVRRKRWAWVALGMLCIFGITAIYVGWFWIELSQTDV